MEETHQSENLLHCAPAFAAHLAHLRVVSSPVWEKTRLWQHLPWVYITWNYICPQWVRKDVVIGASNRITLLLVSCVSSLGSSNHYIICLLTSSLWTLLPYILFFSFPLRDLTPSFPLQLVKLCIGMIDAGKAYNAANKQFVSGIRELAQQSTKDEVIEVTVITFIDICTSRTFSTTCSFYRSRTSWLLPLLTPSIFANLFSVCGAAR